MIDLLMNGNGDLTVTKSGDIALVDNHDDDIIQTANNNIMTRLGENMYHPKIGNSMYKSRLKYTDVGLRMVESCCSDAIKQDTRIKDVENILAMRSGDSEHDCLIQYAVRTVDDKILYNTVTASVWT